MNQYKTCSKCRQTLPVSDYRKNKAAKDGLQSACKPCQKQFYIDNKSKILKQVSEYRKANLDKVRASDLEYRKRNREKARVRAKEWIEANPEKAKATRRAYYVENRAELISKVREWKLANPERARLLDNNSVHRRRQKLSQNGVFKVTVKELRRIRSRPCVYCGATKKVEVDHVIPLDRGGPHSIGNLAPACSRCNRSKSNLFITEWRKRETPRN